MRSEFYLMGLINLILPQLKPLSYAYIHLIAVSHSVPEPFLLHSWLQDLAAETSGPGGRSG